LNPQALRSTNNTTLFQNRLRSGTMPGTPLKYDSFVKPSVDNQSSAFL
jgi:hypothetical protein